MNRKSIIIGIIVIIVGIVITMVMINMKKPLEETKASEPIKYVKTKTVKYETIPGRIKALGRVKAKNIVDIYPEVNGILLPGSAKFREGTYYSKGSPMLIIDSEETELNLLSQKSDFLNILTMIMPDLKADFPNAFDKWQKYLTNYSINKPIAELPKTTSDKEKYFISNRNIYKLYYSIKNTELRLSKYTIRAPFACVVTESRANPGMLISPGQKLGQVQSTNNFELKLDITADEISGISVGNKVEVYEKNKDQSIAGKIIRLGKKVDERTQTVSVFVSVSGKNILDGMYLTGIIEADSLKNVATIPRNALVDNEFVYLTEDEKLRKKRVEVVQIGRENAYIRGIEPGEEVIIEPISNPIVGQKVIPINETNKK